MARRTTPGKVLATSGMAVFLVFLDTTALYVAYPDLRADFAGVSSSSLSWVLNAYTITLAALLIPAGRLADRVGRKRTFVTATALFCAGSMLCGLAPSAGFLVIARILQAVGAAALVPSSLALVLRAFPRERIPVAVAIWGAVGAVAGAVGPTLGAAMVEAWGWRSVFFLNLPVVIGVLVLGRPHLTESKEEHAAPLPEGASIALLAGSVGLISLGVVQSAEWGWASAATVGTIAAGLVALAAFIGRSRRAANPLVDLGLFRLEGVRYGNLALFAFAISFAAMFFGNIQFLTGVWGWSVLRAGFAVAPGPLIVAVLAPVAGRIAARRGQRALLVPGGLVYAAGPLWLLTHATVVPHYASVYLPSTILTGLGVALCLPQLSSVAVQQLPADRSATGSAVSQSVRQVGTTLGVALFIALMGTPGPTEVLDHFHHVWLLIAAGGVTVTLVASRLGRRAPVTAPDPVPTDLLEVPA